MIEIFAPSVFQAGRGGGWSPCGHEACDVAAVISTEWSPVVPTEDGHRPSRRSPEPRNRPTKIRLTDLGQRYESHSMERGQPFQQMSTWSVPGKKRDFHLNLTPDVKSNTKWIRKFNLKHKTIKLSAKKKPGDNLWAPGLGKEFLTLTRKAASIKEKISKLDSIKMNNFCFAKYPMKVLLTEDQVREEMNSQRSTVKTLNNPSRKWVRAMNARLMKKMP